MADFSSCEGVAKYMENLRRAMQERLRVDDRSFISGQLRRIQAQYDAKCGQPAEKSPLAGLSPGAAQPISPPAYSGATLKKTPSAFDKSRF